MLPQLDAPDTVVAGASFSVKVQTFGDGCTSQGDTQLAITGHTAEIRPFDKFTTYLPNNYACPDILAVYAHTVAVHLDQPGTATLHAIGRVSPGDSSTTIERTIVVR
jgi:hypothetical protein